MRADTMPAAIFELWREEDSLAKRSPETTPDTGRILFHDQDR